MRTPDFPRRDPLEMKLIDDPTGEWGEYGGYEYAGGTIVLGGGVGEIRDLEFTYISRPEASVVLGTLVLATAGLPYADIGVKVSLTEAEVHNVMSSIRMHLDTSDRHTLLPLCLDRERRLLRLGAPGRPEDYFQTTVRERTQLGLLARGVSRQIIAEARNKSPNSLDKEFTRFAQRKGTGNAARSVAATIMTLQIDPMTAVPIVKSIKPLGGKRPLLDKAKWDDMVTKPKVEPLRRLFRWIEYQTDWK